MKIQLMNGVQYFVTIPNQIARALSWNKGDVLKCKITKLGRNLGITFYKPKSKEKNILVKEIDSYYNLESKRKKNK